MREDSVAIACYTPGDTRNAYLLLNAASIHFWDITTLYLYFRKMRQFQKDIAASDKNEAADSIVLRIKFILNKMIFLTVVIEIVIIISYGAQGIGWYLKWKWYMSLIAALCSTFSNIVMSVCVYCMIEHNNKDYLKLVQMIKNVGCTFCCCKSVVESGEFMVVSLSDDNTNTSGNQDNIMTNTMKSVEVERLNQTDLSEFTKTITE